MAKKKEIVCNSCRCYKEDNDKLKVTCTGCVGSKEINIICKKCNCVDDSLSNSKRVCLKDCEGENKTIYITCTEYEEDLD